MPRTGSSMDLCRLIPSNATVKKGFRCRFHFHLTKELVQRWFCSRDCFFFSFYRCLIVANVISLFFPRLLLSYCNEFYFSI